MKNSKCMQCGQVQAKETVQAYYSFKFKAEYLAQFSDKKDPETEMNISFSDHAGNCNHLRVCRDCVKSMLLKAYDQLDNTFVGCKNG